MGKPFKTMMKTALNHVKITPLPETDKPKKQVKPGKSLVYALFRQAPPPPDEHSQPQGYPSEASQQGR